MDISIAIQLAIGVAGASIMAWFYPHCARPALAYAGSRPLGFWLALAGTLLASIGFLAAPLLAWVELDELSDLTRIGTFAGALPLLAFTRPTWFVRLGGGPDGSVPARFILTWYWRWWRKAGFSGPRTVEVVHALPIALRGLPPSADQQLVASWTSDLDSLILLGDAGDFDALNAGLEELYEGLARVRPVEPLGGIL